ncbi:MAG: AMP-binding protein [Paracoccaceae bacterium]|nr:AMP-binding protein [Paracoccaceae bacterium]
MSSAGEFDAFPSTSGCVIADRPGGAALRAALAVARGGAAFRIGGGDALPRQGNAPMFETLTGGTSGAPRRIWRSQASWLASFAQNARLFGIGPGVSVSVLGRLAHSLSLYGALEALHLGARLHLLDGMRPDRQRAALAAHRVAVLYATPSQLRLLLEAGGPILPDMAVMLIGGSALDLPLRQALRRLCPGADIRAFFGAAETSFITLADDDTPEGSVGRPYPGVQISLRCADGRGAAEGDLGQIWVRSPYLAEGYGAPEPAGAIWRAGWVSVGEWGRLVAGHLYLAGRSSRMVTVADHNVFPEEIELFLAGLPGVIRAAVLPRPDGLRGHVLEAVLMGDAGQSAAILAALRVKFGALKAPRRLHWRRDWPMLASGKTDLRALEVIWPPL